MRHLISLVAKAAHPGGMCRTSAPAALVAAASLPLTGPPGSQRAGATAVDLAYAQVKNDFLVLAGCVKADIPTNTAEDLHDDSKTNDHPATPVDRGR